MTAPAVLPGSGMARYSPFHHSGTRLSYQGEAGFSDCPPGYTPTAKTYEGVWP